VMFGWLSNDIFMMEVLDVVLVNDPGDEGFWSRRYMNRLCEHEIYNDFVAT
jgi:hypothetical protein